jgi:hypothetical protein
MVRTATLAFAVMLVSLVVAPRAGEAQGRGKGKRAQASAPAGFTAAERDLVVRYYADHPDGGKRLPPRVGFEVSIVGDRVVLLDAQGLVVDLFVNVFR